MTEQKSAVRFKLPPLSIIRALWKGKAWIVLIWLVASAGTAVVVCVLPARYKAETVILVESQRIPEAFVASTVSTDLRDRLSSLSQQILSYSRLLSIVKKFDLYRDERANSVEEQIIEMMRKDIDIRLEKGWSEHRPGAFRISYEGPNPSVVAQVTNQLGNLFIDENLRAREVQATGTSEFLENQLVEAKKRLEEQEEKLSSYKLRYNGELPEQESTLNTALTRLQIQLQGVQDSLNRTQQQKIMQENEIEAARTSLQTMTKIIEELNAPDHSRSDPATPLKESELLEKELTHLVARYTDQHPEVKRIREALQKARERENDEARLSALKAPGSDGDPALPRSEIGNKRRAAFEQNLVRERERVENLKAQGVIVEKRLASLNEERQHVLRESALVQARLSQLPIREQQLAGITRDYEISKANYRSLLDKRLAAEMAADMERRQKSERFTMLDPARVPEKPVKPNRSLFYVLGSSLGLLLGLATAFAWEWRKNCLLGEWEFPKGTVLLGRIPEIAGGGRQISKVRDFVMTVSGLFLVAVIVSAGIYFGWYS